jgi:hypothetical protein
MRYLIIVALVGCSGGYEVDDVPIMQYLSADQSVPIRVVAEDGYPEPLQYQVQKAMKQWLAAIQEVAAVPLTSAERIDFQPTGETAFGVTKHETEGRAHTIGHAWITLYKWDFDDVVLHEVGHVFGMVDTYEGKSRCKGRELSIMCDPQVGIQSIDIQNVQTIFCNERPDLCKN